MRYWLSTDVLCPRIEVLTAGLVAGRLGRKRGDLGSWSIEHLFQLSDTVFEGHDSGLGFGMIAVASLAAQTEAEAAWRDDQQACSKNQPRRKR